MTTQEEQKKQVSFVIEDMLEKDLAFHFLVVRSHKTIKQIHT